MAEITVSQWNDMITKSLIPNIVILSIYIVLGTCGNILVLSVYTFQMKGLSDERYFIPILSVFDMVVTIYCGLFLIIQCFHQVTFSNNILCKTAQFFAGLTTFIPILLLLIIAVQRYLKVCMPHKPVMSLRVKRIALILTIVISLICAFPLPFVYGSVPFHSVNYGINGTNCGKLKEGHQLARAVYAIVIGFLAVATVTTLIVLYSRIGCTVFRQFKLNKSNSNRVEVGKSETKTDDEEVSEVGQNGGIQTSITSDGDSNISNTNIAKNHQTTLSGSKRRQKSNRRITHKLTIMFFVITLVFVLSYLPKVVLLIIEGLYEDFWEQLSDTRRSGVLFIYEMFIINNIVNPFIYAFMDIKFRKEATVFLNRVFHCKF
ncbi:cholecystokinin receptor-like [Mytilus californianus]|uniref:cholecystokinin receptor-like n=1 Tax=Mytilus californianus TaxID=6549 RepID=UPI00224852AD|nr:cholecystokinin receptor-like [Mytilus californianus]